MRTSRLRGPRRRAISETFVRSRPRLFLEREEDGTCTSALFARMIRRDSFLTSADKDWSMVSGGFSQWWENKIVAGDATGTYEFQGVRFLTHCPVADDEDWGPVEASSSLTYPYNFSPVTGTSQNASSPYFESCKSEHFREADVSKIVVPVVLLSGTQAIDLQLDSFRLIENGTPKSIISGGNVSAAYSNQFSTWWQPVFTLPTPFKFKRNVVYGLDVWLTGVKSGGGDAMTLNVGAQSTALGSRTDVGHKGDLAFQLRANAGWDPATQNYECTFTGGSFRPFSADTSTFTTGVNLTNCYAHRFGTGSIEMYLDWWREIPFFMLRNSAGTRQWYVPQDDSNYITTYNYMNAASTERRYAWVQQPGGTWDGITSRTFVPWFATQNNNTGTFTPASLAISWPTSVTIERV